MIYVAVVTNFTRAMPLIEGVDEYGGETEWMTSFIGTSRDRVVAAASAWVRENDDNDHPHRILIGELTAEARTAITFTEAPISIPRGRAQTIDNEETE